MFKQTLKIHVRGYLQEQFKKRVRSLETLLAEERKKVSSLEKKLEITGSDVISSAMSDDVKLHIREKELLQSEVRLLSLIRCRNLLFVGF